MKRRWNPSGVTWAALAAGSAAAVGLGAYAWRRRRLDVTPTEPTEPVGPSQSPVWIWRRSSDPGYPWLEPTLHVENYPTPGMFFDVGDDTGAFDPAQGFDAMVTALLGSALVMAGWDPARATAIAQAQGQDPDAQLGRRLRRDTRRALLVPGSWNDRLFGQTNANYAGGTDPGKPCTSGSTNAPCTNGIRDPHATAVRYMMNAAGRGLNWLPRHTNVLDAIAQGVPPVRGTGIDGDAFAGSHSHMLVWMPAFDMVALGNQADPQIRLAVFPGGASGGDPPPSVTDLGIDMHGVTLAA